MALCLQITAFARALRQLPIQTLELIVFPQTLQVPKIDHDFDLITETASSVSTMAGYQLSDRDSI